MNDKNKKGLTKIHSARFYGLTPRSINGLAFNKTSCKLAVSRLGFCFILLKKRNFFIKKCIFLPRSDGSIEIWDTRYAIYMEKSILNLHVSVEALGWIKNRLFSVGQSGGIVEWDLKTLRSKKTILLTGNLAWCMDINRAQNGIAIGTEEGYINIFSVDEDELNFSKIFDKQEGRILCCKYDHSGDILVTGSLDTVRIWNVKTGQAIYKMATGRSEAKKETVVWSVEVLKDLTIISGDSRGRLTIWDGKIGAQIDTFPVLKADVLSIAVNEDETTLCCSGIDPIIKMFVLTPVKKDNIVKNQWIKFIQRSVHEHDVMALAFSGNRVFSGGIDGYLGVSYSSKSHKQHLTKYGPFLPQPCAIVARTARLLLLKYFNYLELWQLGTPNDTIQLCDDDMDKGKFLALDRNLAKLLDLRSWNDEPILCCTMSADGNWLIYSTESVVRMFKVQIQVKTRLDIFLGFVLIFFLIFRTTKLFNYPK